MARANAVILRTRKLETAKPPGFVIPKKCYATAPIATIKLAIGVITPNKRHKPAAKENEVTINALKSGHARRNWAPLNMITLATTARSSNKPTPGHPPGNVVKSRCSEISPNNEFQINFSGFFCEANPTKMVSFDTAFGLLPRQPGGEFVGLSEMDNATADANCYCFRAIAGS